MGCSPVPGVDEAERDRRGGPWRVVGDRVVDVLVGLLTRNDGRSSLRNRAGSLAHPVTQTFEGGRHPPATQAPWPRRQAAHPQALPILILGSIAHVLLLLCRSRVRSPAGPRRISYCRAGKCSSCSWAQASRFGKFGKAAELLHRASHAGDCIRSADGRSGWLEVVVADRAQSRWEWRGWRASGPAFTSCR